MAVVPARAEVPVDAVAVTAYTVPTDRPESDGTFEWDETTVVVVEVAAGGARGLGFSYMGEAAAKVIERRLAPQIAGRDAMDVPAAWQAMVGAVRNVGLPGIAASAISAVDVALWDLKARLLDLPLVRLLGAARSRIPVYGSGGFTSYDAVELKEELGAWADAGIDQVKIKVGRTPRDDVARVRAARSAIGPDIGLFVDANGAYTPKQALALAGEFARYAVNWFEEPVPSGDLDGLRLLRERAPAGMEIAAGEYGYDAPYFRRMLEAGAVDVLQADATRCLGITGFSPPARSPMRSASRCRRIRHRRCICMSPAPCRTCAISSGSTTMLGSRGCSSTAQSLPRAVSSGRIRVDRALASSSSASTPSDTSSSLRPISPRPRRRRRSRRAHPSYFRRRRAPRRAR